MSIQLSTYILFLLHPGKWVRSIVVSLSVCLCVCVCVCEHISGTAGPMFRKFFVHIPCGHGSVLLWRRCNTLCTSSFMDDVAFGHNGPYAETQRLHHLEITTTSCSAIPGQSLMPMNACLLLWPWPWPNDLDLWTWRRYSEGVPASQIQTF